MKSFAVAPLICGVAATATLVPALVNVATNAVTFVPNGTVAEIDEPAIVAWTSARSAGGLLADKNRNEVIDFAELAAEITVTR